MAQLRLAAMVEERRRVLRETAAARSKSRPVGARQKAEALLAWFEDRPNGYTCWCNVRGTNHPCCMLVVGQRDGQPQIGPQYHLGQFHKDVFRTLPFAPYRSITNGLQVD